MCPFLAQNDATYGGYYSGFTQDPIIEIEPSINGAACDNTNKTLSIANALDNYDQLQWISIDSNGVEQVVLSESEPNITGEFTPTNPGNYFARALLNVVQVLILKLFL